MAHPRLDSMLLATSDPERLRAWYVGALAPESDEFVDGYHVLTFGAFNMLIDGRDDVPALATDPARMTLNFLVDDARATVARIESEGTNWVAELENRDGSWFATAVDPDGNHVQVIELSEAHRAAMAAM